MSAALYVVLEDGSAGIDPFVNGKALARAEPVLPGLYIGTRIIAERLLWPQQMYEGASPPAPALRAEPPQMRL